jgi:AraC family transcriptional regulator, transcriptional activator FtrA
MPYIVRIMPKQAAPENRLVAALAYDGLCAFEFGIVAEVFGLHRPEMGPNWYRFITCAEHRGPLRTNAGLKVEAEAGLDALSEAGTIVIPGWLSDGTDPTEGLRDVLLSAHARGARLVTICSGTFLLASVGLLDGRRATTHWRYAELLRTLHPAVTVDADVLYAEDGTIFTSAGSAAGVDLLLHLVRKDFGPDAANSVARRMVVAAHRSGGQAQFIERPVAIRPENQLGSLLDRIRAEPARSWTIAQMADTAAMSPRTLVRRFREATGVSPGAWLTEQRLSVARDLLETTGLSIERVAEEAGMGSATNLRLHFTSKVGVPPNVYRKQFHRQRQQTSGFGGCLTPALIPGIWSRAAAPRRRDHHHASDPPLCRSSCRTSRRSTLMEMSDGTLFDGPCLPGAAALERRPLDGSKARAEAAAGLGDPLLA